MSGQYRSSLSQLASSEYAIERMLSSLLHILSLLLSLEVVQQYVPLLALLTPIADNNATAVDDLAGISFAVEHTQASPFAEHLSIRDLDERDLVFGAESND